MVDNKNNGRRASSRLFLNNAGMALCGGVFLAAAFLPCNVCAEAEALATERIDAVESAELHGDSQLDIKSIDTHVTFEAPVLESAPSRIDTGLSDVAQLDTSMEEQNLQPALVASREVLSLDVVDTGSSVDFPQAVVDMNGDQYISQEMVIDASDAVLPLTSAPEKYQTHDVSVRHGQDDKKNDRPEGASSNAIGEDDSGAGLPYAVLLALLALIGLVPVARRNDHHRV